MQFDSRVLNVEAKHTYKIKCHVKNLFCDCNDGAEINFELASAQPFIIRYQHPPSPTSSAICKNKNC